MYTWWSPIKLQLGMDVLRTEAGSSQCKDFTHTHDLSNACKVSWRVCDAPTFQTYSTKEESETRIRILFFDQWRLEALGSEARAMFAALAFYDRLIMALQTLPALEPKGWLSNLWSLLGSFIYGT